MLNIQSVLRSKHTSSRL